VWQLAPEDGGSFPFAHFLSLNLNLKKDIEFHCAQDLIGRDGLPLGICFVERRSGRETETPSILEKEGRLTSFGDAPQR
jgi:hypothetical protein